jgi:hypothetical protein
MGPTAIARPSTFFLVAVLLATVIWGYFYSQSGKTQSAAALQDCQEQLLSTVSKLDESRNAQKAMATELKSSISHKEDLQSRLREQEHQGVELKAKLEEHTEGARQLKERLKEVESKLNKAEDDAVCARAQMREREEEVVKPADLRIPRIFHRISIPDWSVWEAQASAACRGVGTPLSMRVHNLPTSQQSTFHAASHIHVPIQLAAGRCGPG